jgi:hypothetical protein
VAVCDFAKFRGEDLGNTGHKRVSAKIEHLTVTIEYEHTILNTHPTPVHWQCEFRFEDGRFFLDRESLKKNSRCTRMKIKPGAKPPIVSIEVPCLETNEKWRAELGFKTIIEWPLGKPGIYPIKQADTKMRP